MANSGTQHNSEMGEVSMHVLEPQNRSEGDGVALVLGDIATFSELKDGPLVRMHSRCLYGEVFESLDCECGPQLLAAQQQIAQEGRGILFYLEQEGRGAGLITKAKAYALKDEGLDTAAAYERLRVPFDSRQYGHCGRYLLEHGMRTVRLMSNNPRKVNSLKSIGIAVQRVPLLVGVNEQNKAYLRVKRDFGGHLLPEDL